MASIGFREAMVRYSSKFTMGRCHTSVLSSHGPPLVGTKEVSPGLPRMELPCPHLADLRSEEHTSELQSRENLVCRLLLEKKKYVNSSFARIRSDSCTT